MNNETFKHLQAKVVLSFIEQQERELSKETEKLSKALDLKKALREAVSSHAKTLCDALARYEYHIRAKERGEGTDYLATAEYKVNEAIAAYEQFRWNTEKAAA